MAQHVPDPGCGSGRKIVDAKGVSRLYRQQGLRLGADRACARRRRYRGHRRSPSCPPGRSSSATSARDVGRVQLLADRTLVVIDFRYHLVSIVAVFLALGLGIVLGSTALRAPRSAGWTAPRAASAEAERGDAENSAAPAGDRQGPRVRAGGSAGAAGAPARRPARRAGHRAGRAGQASSTASRPRSARRAPRSAARSPCRPSSSTPAPAI